MLESLDPSAQWFLADLGRIQKGITRAQQQVSSGVRVSAPSDAPDQISDILQLYADIQRNSQIQTNLNRVKSETDTAEQTLQTTVQLVDRAMELASEGTSTVETAATRQTLAGEVQSLLEQLVSASRTTVQGQYIFSGDQDQAPAYQLNLANPDGVDRLLTTDATRQIQHPSGATFSAAKTAQEIFDNRNADDSLADDNVFAAVNGLRIALAANDETGISNALTALRRAGDHLNSELSFYGTVQNKISEALDFSSRFEVQLKTELSNRRDADITAAALELQQYETGQAAAYATRANMPQTSLFDYLK
jgi:flagellar hook-associated protein 3 FlgL